MDAKMTGKKEMARPFEEEGIIRVDNLNLYAGKTHILKNVNIEIPKNKLTVILGPSGCGKTTLLKCMNRLTDLTPDIEPAYRPYPGYQGEREYLYRRPASVRLQDGYRGFAAEDGAVVAASVPVADEHL